METATIPSPGAQASNPPAQPAQPMALASADHGYTKGCPCPKCEAKRAKWREKGRARENPLRAGAPGPGAQPAPVARPALSVVQPMANTLQPGLGGSTFVPWSADTIRPLLETVVPLVEKADVRSLVEEAAKVSAQCAELISKKAFWNVAAKAALIQSGAEMFAKWMNRWGISAEYAPEISFALAACSIWAGRQSLLEEIRKLAKEKKAAAAKELPKAA